MASKGKAPAGASTTGPRMAPPPTSSTPVISQPAAKTPIFIDLTKDNESEGKSKEENPERKLVNTLRKMIGLKELDSDDSSLGLPSSTSSSSEEDDILGNDLGFWDYDDLDDWGTAEPAASSEASCTSYPSPNY
ncbi:hypothetical protein PIB30_082873 [Stylosanthes scabra]|uniref:Uncharacterized protein n=1 Tax=Stylosanthes scabra TaxID=79078 RepID=A0ABU6TSJ1_9FABA|nr:hypothetical protein [Stylosanthes scabra]